MHDFLNLLSENKNEKGRGSLEGRKAINSKGKNHTNAVKSRVKIYNSITDALRNGHMGQIFSTKESDRLYVITKQKWGTDDEQIINGRSAKGFTPGNIPSKFSDVKKYAIRTMVRHSGDSAISHKSKTYWKNKHK